MKKLTAIVLSVILMLQSSVVAATAIEFDFDFSPLRYVRQAGYETGSLFANGESAAQDNFALYSPDGEVYATDLVPEDSPYEVPGESVAGAFQNKSLKYPFARVDLPLYPKDYYWGKYQNGAAGAHELNKIPALRPGDYVRVIGDGYLTLSPSSGYVQPYNGYYYGSGLCWSTSALGQMMDAANYQFDKRFGIPLFVFGPGDRAPHGKWYKTYQYSNGGYGYTVIKIGNGGQDYRFRVNPEIKNIEGMEDFMFKIVMTASDSDPDAYKGQSIGSYLMTNKDLRMVKYTNPKIFLEKIKTDFTNYFKTFRRSHTSD